MELCFCNNSVIILQFSVNCVDVTNNLLITNITLYSGISQLIEHVAMGSNTFGIFQLVINSITSILFSLLIVSIPQFS